MQSFTWRTVVRIGMVVAVAISIGFWLLANTSATSPTGDGVHEWHSISPSQGGVYNFAISRQNPDIVFAGHPFGIYRTVDVGASWQLVMNRFEGIISPLIAIDPFNSNNVHAIGESAIAYSSDNGTTWTEVDFDSTEILSGIQYDPLIPDRLYYISDAHILKSAGGATALEVVTTGTSLLINPQNSAQWYKNDSDGIYRSEDSGATWTRVSTAQNLTLQAIDPLTPTTLYGFGRDKFNTLYQSTNGGVTWTVLLGAADGVQLQSLAIDPFDTTILYAGVQDMQGYGQILRSGDYGASWQPLSAGLPTPVYSYQNTPPILIADPLRQGHLYVSYGEYGLYRTTTRGDGWMPRSKGISQYLGVKVMLAPQNPDHLYFVDSRTLQRSEDAGATWTILGAELEEWIGALALHPQEADTLYIGTGDLGVLKSSDGGVSWTAVNNGLPDPDDAFVSYVGMSPLTPTIVYSYFSLYSDTYRSTNGGATWALIQDLEDYTLWDITFHPTNPAIAYAATGQGLFITGDSGITWSELTLPLDGNAYVSKIAIDPTTPTTMYAAAVNNTHSLYKSSDNGATWLPLTLNGVPQGRAIHDIQIDASTPTSVYVAYNSNYLDITYGYGILRSADGGATWTKDDQGLYPAVTSIALHPTDPTRVYAATYGQGVYRSRAPQGEIGFSTEAITVTHAQTTTLPTAFALQLNNQGYAPLTWSASVKPTAATCTGAAAVPWATVSAITGSTAPLASTPLEVTLNSASLSVGVYSAVLCFSSNDPATPLTTLPITLTVSATATPELGVSVPALDFNLPYGEEVARPLRLENSGNAQLDWELGLLNGTTCNTVATSEWLSWSAGRGSINPSDQDIIVLNFDTSALANGIYREILCIRNSTTLNYSTIPVTLAVSGSPISPTPVPSPTPIPSATTTPPNRMLYLPLVDR